ncbi:MAG: inositol monophosphatase family protein [Pseudomonadota bacterium]
MNDDRLAFARDLAQHVGAFALECFLAGPKDVASKAPGDLVTEVDREVERRCRDAIGSAYPRDAVLGEEFGGRLLENTWVIDPIDGTQNFTLGVPFWCISIGFLIDGAPVLGVVHDPLHQETFWALEGRGAFCNAAAITPSDRTAFSGATIGFGLAAHRDAGSTLALLAQLSTAQASVRGQGAGALSLCHVACGRLDGFFEERIHLWDVAAALVLLREAGGKARFAIDADAPQRAAPVHALAPGLGRSVRSVLDRATLEAFGIDPAP